MAKISNLVRFSEHFGVDSSKLASLGVLNPSLNVDTKLFVDPMLLEFSQHREIRECAREEYKAHFAMVIKFLQKSKSSDDVAWKTAERMLSFPEVKGTCLGYGAASVSGSGSGKDMTAHLLRTAKEIVELGVDDPDLFVAMSLFEGGFGPDRISDMTTKVILKSLLAFNRRVLGELHVPCSTVSLECADGSSIRTDLPVNPCVRGGTPIILVPCDILRDLPIAKDWYDISRAASKNAELRSRVNRDVAKLWKRKTLEEKAKLRDWALSSKEAFKTLTDMIHAVEPKSYDFASDPAGEFGWREVIASIAAKVPMRIPPPEKMDLVEATKIVWKIVDQFKFLIEDRRLSEGLHHKGHPLPEGVAQRYFFAVASAYCKANNLDLTPEAETGNGPVDFKISNGFSDKVVVEIKLSSNTKLVSGYTKQLDTYMKAEETTNGFYVVIDVGHMGHKDDALLAAKNEAVARGQRAAPIVFVDAIRRPSASRL